MQSEGTMVAQVMSAGARKRSLGVTTRIFFYPGTTVHFHTGNQ
jgi:hypothetical protein